MNVSFPVHVTDFPPGSAWARLNNAWPKPQTFVWSDIIRAAMVAGYPDLAALPSRQFARWRTAAFHLGLRHSDGQLVQPPEWSQLDPSEKASVSSLLGLVVTKLLVERLLNAPLFLFLDVHFTVNYPPGVERIRPDFAAMTPAGKWFSVEAKGKSRFRQATLDRAKRQAKALGTVNAEPVLAGVACVTSFRRGRMEARFADPSPSPEEAPDAHVDPMEALRQYYGQLDRFRKFSEPLTEFAAPGVPDSYRGVRFMRSSELDADFGIIPDLERALGERRPENALSILSRLTDRRISDSHPELGADGIVVIPGESWRYDV